MKLLLFCLFASISLSLANGECHVSVWLLVLRYFFGHVTSFAISLCYAMSWLSLELIKDFNLRLKKSKRRIFLPSRIRY